MRSAILLVLTLQIALPACWRASGGRTGEDNLIGSTDSDSSLGFFDGSDDSTGSDPLVACDDLSYLPSGAYDLISLDVDGDYLVVEVRYGGGCEQHKWVLCWEESWEESDPPVVFVQLYHEDNNDSCKALIQNTHLFNISSLKEHFDGQVSISLGDLQTMYEW